MKYLAIISVLLLLIEVQSRAHKKFEPEETCTAELKLSRHKMKSVVNEINTPENSQKYGKFFVCVFRKRDVMDEGGRIKQEGLKAFLHQVFHERSRTPEDEKVIVNHIFDDCSTILQDYSLRTAVRLKNCVARNIKEYDTDF